MARSPLYIGSFLLGWIALAATAAQAQPASAPTFTLDTSKAPAKATDPEIEKMAQDRQAIRSDKPKVDKINARFAEAAEIVNQNLGGDVGRFFVTFYIDKDPIADSDLAYLRFNQVVDSRLAQIPEPKGHGWHAFASGATLPAAAGAILGGAILGPAGAVGGGACIGFVGGVAGWCTDKVIHFFSDDEKTVFRPLAYLELPFPHNPFSTDAKYIAKGVVERFQQEIADYREYDKERYDFCMKDSTPETHSDCNIEWDISPLVGAEAVAAAAALEGIEP